jgi:hypothetical protein
MESHPDSLPASLTIDLTGLPERVVRQVREIVEEARREQAKHVPEQEGKAERPSLFGRYAQPGIPLTQEEFKKARREAWANFPRELPEP